MPGCAPAGPTQPDARSMSKYSRRTDTKREPASTRRPRQIAAPFTRPYRLSEIIEVRSKAGESFASVYTSASPSRGLADQPYCHHPSELTRKRAKNLVTVTDVARCDFRCARPESAGHELASRCFWCFSNAATKSDTPPRASRSSDSSPTNVILSDHQDLPISALITAIRVTSTLPR
jgi:hypothetical protein